MFEFCVDGSGFSVMIGSPSRRGRRAVAQARRRVVFLLIITRQLAICLLTTTVELALWLFVSSGGKRTGSSFKLWLRREKTWSG